MYSYCTRAWNPRGRTLAAEIAKPRSCTSAAKRNFELLPGYLFRTLVGGVPSRPSAVLHEFET
ncbi:hypothetical protein JCM24511_06175 [Saitozyma sp. JCM 24511]|nr:hypothetical protein JCM24511_06175 [Saitozyma sp. JCM 24511]